MSWFRRKKEKYYTLDTTKMPDKEFMKLLKVHFQGCRVNNLSMVDKKYLIEHEE